VALTATIVINYILYTFIITLIVTRGGRAGSEVRLVMACPWICKSQGPRGGCLQAPIFLKKFFKSFLRLGTRLCRGGLETL